MNEPRCAGCGVRNQAADVASSGGDGLVTVAGDDWPMKTPSSDRTGVLIVRLWIEGNARDGLRARITQTLDSAGTERHVAVAATPEAVCTVVQKWVDEFVSSN